MSPLQRMAKVQAPAGFRTDASRSLLILDFLLPVGLPECFLFWVGFDFVRAHRLHHTTDSSKPSLGLIGATLRYHWSLALVAGTLPHLSHSRVDVLPHSPHTSLMACSLPNCMSDCLTGFMHVLIAYRLLSMACHYVSQDVYLQLGLYQSSFHRFQVPSVQTISSSLLHNLHSATS